MESTVEKINEIERKLKELPPKIYRGVSAVLGSCVADAATRPLHWIYRKGELELILAEGRKEGILQPEFWPTNKSPFYNVPTGGRSGYNHILQAGLQACINSGGALNLAEYLKVVQNKFGAGTEWQEAYARRKQRYDSNRRAEWTTPVDGPWIHECVLHLLQEGKGDQENLDMDGFLFSLPHLVFNVENEEVLQECQKITELLTTNPLTLRCAEVQSRLLKNIITKESLDLGSLPPQDLTLLQDPLNRKTESHVDLVRELGNNCHLPGSMLGAIHSVLISSSFIAAVRNCILAGGCNCSRSNYAGALMSALNGLEDIPEAWKMQTADYLEMATLALKCATNIKVQ